MKKIVRNSLLSLVFYSIIYPTVPTDKTTLTITHKIKGNRSVQLPMTWSVMQPTSMNAFQQQMVA